MRIPPGSGFFGRCLMKYKLYFDKRRMAGAVLFRPLGDETEGRAYLPAYLVRVDGWRGLRSEAKQPREGRILLICQTRRAFSYQALSDVPEGWYVTYGRETMVCWAL